MVLSVSTYGMQPISIFPVAPPTILFPALSPAAQEALRCLFHVLPPPAGAFGQTLVIQSSLAAVKAYGASLKNPTQDFINVLDKLEPLRPLSADSKTSGEQYEAAFRHTTRAPAWKLFLAPHQYLEDRVLKAIGADLAFAISSTLPFRKTFAEKLLKLISSKESLALTPSVNKCCLDAFHRADQLFEECVGSSLSLTQQISAETRFREAVTSRFNALIFYGRDRQHQAIPDHRSMSAPQIHASAREIKAAVFDGSKTHLFHLISSLTGLPMETAYHLPLQAHVQEEWIMALDAEQACLKISMGLFAPGRARTENNPGLWESGDMIVTPLPAFVTNLLSDSLLDRPAAATLGQLLLDKLPATNTTLTGNDSGLRATFARFRNGLAPFAVSKGISRFHAAILTCEPGSIPRAKYHYSLVERQEIWGAAERLFSALDWGTPVPFLDGPAVGSRITPKDETVQAWFQWMTTTVASTSPGRHTSLASLIEYHNRFALLSASLAVFFLALRHRKVLPLMADQWQPGVSTIPVFDKRTGEAPGPRLIPLSKVLKEQLSYWHAHCKGIARRLENMGLPTKHPVRKALGRFHSSHGPLFFTFDKAGIAQPLGSQSLVDWWPAELGLRGNFGRHYWQRHLRRSRAMETDIDNFVRHSLAGMNRNSSASDQSSMAMARRLSPSLDAAANDLTISAFRGLPAGRAK